MPQPWASRCRARVIRAFCRQATGDRPVARLTNRTTEPVEIVEVQFGSYLGEDDIVRLSDDYGRA